MGCLYGETLAITCTRCKREQPAGSFLVYLAHRGSDGKNETENGLIYFKTTAVVCDTCRGVRNPRREGNALVLTLGGFGKEFGDTMLVAVSALVKGEN